MNMTLFLLAHLILFAPIIFVFAYVIISICKDLQRLEDEDDPYRCPLNPEERKKVRDQAFHTYITTVPNNPHTEINTNHS